MKQVGIEIPVELPKVQPPQEPRRINPYRIAAINEHQAASSNQKVSPDVVFVKTFVNALMKNIQKAATNKLSK